MKTVSEALEVLEQIRQAREALDALEFAVGVSDSVREACGSACELLLDYADMIRALPLRQG